ncbi:MAG: hypothetical protein K6D97_08680 [Clostridia bacterium]|nr:hypothetical protein [Clostridia bacterium]
MTNHKTVVVDGKIVHIHEFDDGSTMVTGLDEAINKDTNTDNTPIDLKGVRKSVAIPYILTAILVSLPTIVIIGAFIYAFISVMANK